MYQAESWLNAYQYQIDILLQQQMILHITIFGSGAFQSYTVINKFIFFIFLFLLSTKFTFVTTNIHWCFLLYSEGTLVQESLFAKKEMLP